MDGDTEEVECLVQWKELEKEYETVCLGVDNIGSLCIECVVDNLEASIASS